MPTFSWINGGLPMALRSLRSLFIALALTASGAVPVMAQADGKSLVVFAAASLKNALDAIAADWRASDGTEVKVSYAASSALAKQIAGGAPADLFISADIPWMDDVGGKGMIAPGTRRNLLGNTLVMVAGPDWKGEAITISAGFPLGDLLESGRLAVADTSAVPAGKYAKAALQSLGVWPSVEGKLAQAENVRAALALVARGEAPLGIVYGSDARAEAKVRVVGVFPEGSHPPVIYPAAVLSESSHPKARGFLDYLGGTSAKERFEAEGFTVIAKELAN